jgi:predicted nucleic acid-binding protein
VVVSGQTQQLVRQQLVPAVALLVLQLLVLGVVLLEQKRLRQQLRLIQDVLPLQQLYQLRHQLQEEFQQLVKGFQYQPCQ